MGRTSKLLRRIADRLEPQQQKGLTAVDGSRGWWPVIRESVRGAWQANVTVTLEDGLQYWAVFRSISLISGDFAKCRPKIVAHQASGIWKEVTNPDFSPVLAKPNGLQTRIQFFQNWSESKLSRGNAYILKQRDARERVVALYVLDPGRCRPMVSNDGVVFYELLRDNVTGIEDRVLVPASEIIHDRWNCLYHPLAGLSPLYAAGINALTALRGEQNAARLFSNSAKPGGILSSDSKIAQETAERIKEYWDENFVGEHAGKVAVLGDGLKYQHTAMTAVEAELINTLKWNDSAIAGAFGIPAYMINAGTAPAYNNVEALAQQYYTQCLQIHFEAAELLLDEGLGLTDAGGKLGVEFDLEDLLRMDTPTKVKTVGEAIKAGFMSPNEARAKFDLAPVPGGNTPYLQQQNYSLAALDKRDTGEDPFAKTTPAPAADDEPDDAGDDEEQEAEIRSALRSGMH